MNDANTTFNKLRNLLKGRVISSKRTVYHCIHICETSIIFSQTDGTGKVMIPTEVALEWIEAFQSGKINLGMKSREMRDLVKSRSEWASYQHGFETHLSSLVQAWSNSPDEPIPIREGQRSR